MTPNGATGGHEARRTPFNFSDWGGERLADDKRWRQWFKPWRTIADETVADPSLPQLEVLREGILNRRRLLALVRDFTPSEPARSGSPSATSSRSGAGGRTAAAP